MSRQPSTSSTELPGTSSAGRFDLDCAVPYSRNLWGDDATLEDWTTLEIACMPGEVFIFHGDELRAPDSRTAEDKLAFALRRVCHLLVDRIDAKGLQETFHSLAEFYEYYRPIEASRDRLPEPLIPDSQCSVIRRILPSVQERPFHISEE